MHLRSVRPLHRAGLPLRTALTVAACTLAGACTDADAPSLGGEMRMGVVGQDAEGNFYRLRDGVFDISGPEAVMVSTEDSATPLETLSLELAAGNYDVELGAGWRLERWDPVLDATLDVAATLTSENPTTAVVTGSGTETVVFTFLVEDAGPVTLGDGDLEIDIDVDVVPPLTACDPLVQDCDVGEACYLGDPAGAQPFVCASSLPGGLYEPCEFINACDVGLTCAASVAHAACDDAELGCCLAFCDVSAPNCEAGDTCTSVGAPDPNVGLCIG